MRKALFLLFLCSLAAKVKGSPPLVDHVELRAAAVFPRSEKFRKIYGDIGVEYQLQATKGIGCSACKTFGCETWMNLGWFPKSGHPIGSCGSTSSNIFSLNLGLRALTYGCDHLRFHLGAGLSSAWINIRNQLQCCQECVEKSIDHRSRVALGGVIQGGILCYVSPRACIDLFGEYLSLPVCFDHYVNVGGVKVGLGLGWTF